MDTVDGEDGLVDIQEYLEYAEALGNRDLGDVKVLKWLSLLIVYAWLLCVCTRIVTLSFQSSCAVPRASIISVFFLTIKVRDVMVF
jgi:hypothetical protein